MKRTIQSEEQIIGILQEHEDEKLKRLLAEQMLDMAAMMELLSKKW